MIDLTEIIQEIAKTRGVSNIQVMLCEVVSIDLDNRTANVVSITDNLSEFPAQIMSDVADGLLIIPAIGSTVKVLLSEICTPTIIQYSEIEELFIVSGGSAIKVYSSGVELQGDSFGGIPKAGTTAERIKRLEDAFNDFVLAFNTHNHPTAPTGPVSPPAIIPPAIAPTSITPTTTQSDLENIKVKHGNGV